MAWTTPRTWTPGEMVTASLLNTELRDNELYLVGDAAWLAPTFQNGWLNYAGGTQPAGYRKIGDTVYVRGTVKSGTVNTVVFTLPVGYRPLTAHIYACLSNAALGRWTLSTNGNMTLAIGSNVWASLDGIGFEVT
jgi:hypothetical protein